MVVSPGVPADHPALAGCRARGVPVLGEVELAYRTMTAEFVAITGTNGKTTTTALTGALLAESGRPVLVGGNIGRPLAAEALDFPADGWVVAEVSSFQLETTDAFRPRVAAVLNVTPDHLDRHGSLAAYAEAKARIFRAQGPEDWAVLNADDPGAAALAPRVRARLLWFSRRQPVTEGAWVRDGWVTLRLGARGPAGLPRRRHLPPRRPQPRERARRDGVRRRPRRAARSPQGGHPRLPGRAAPDRVDPRPRRGRLLQRLEGHERRRHAEGPRGLRRADRADRRRARQGPALRRAGRRGAGAGQGRDRDRRGSRHAGARRSAA